MSYGLGSSEDGENMPVILKDEHDRHQLAILGTQIKSHPKNIRLPEGITGQRWGCISRERRLRMLRT